MSSAACTELAVMSWSRTISPSFTFFSTARSTAAVSEVAQSRGSTDQLRIASCRASATCRTASLQQPPGGRRNTGSHPSGSSACVSMISDATVRRLISFMVLWV